MDDLADVGVEEPRTGARGSSGGDGGCAADETITRAEGGIEESIYDMPAFVTFTVGDLAGALRWYTEALGFIVLAELPGPGGRTALVHLRRHRYQDILLVPGVITGEDHSRRGGPGVSYTVSAGSEDLKVRGARARATGLGRVEGPVRTAWNTVDLVCEDIDGHQVVFTQHVGAGAGDEAFSAAVRASVQA